MGDLLTAAEVAEAERLANAATPGPWEALYEPYGITGGNAEIRSDSDGYLVVYSLDGCGGVQKRDDAEFIAAAREGYPKALATIRALEDALGALVATEPIDNHVNESCVYCDGHWNGAPSGLAIKHRPKCPWLRARALLERLGVEGKGN
jgi:hypothetical protein